MISSLFRTFFFQPLYNAFIVLFDFFPWLDAGVLVILFTLLVKLALFPLSRKAITAQLSMKQIEPELTQIREKYKDKQEQARRTMDLYKTKKVNPFSSIFVIFIQLPIVLALYFVFLRSGLPAVNETLLYSFVPRPENINMAFLGLIDIAGKNYLLALLAGVSSFFQIRFSVQPHKPSTVRSFRDDLARSMNIQMRYVFPIIVFFISYNISGAVALYWFTSNLFTLGQELVVRKKLKSQNTERKT
ncbi:YidC/Oxa1 family membrane protein insertase [Patescibacteria group bacterium]|nr:MAG: YidC/Oxa1 family membrane protein insertase [Patescibacteria group bacterium]